MTPDRLKERLKSILDSFAYLKDAEASLGINDYPVRLSYHWKATEISEDQRNIHLQMLRGEWTEVADVIVKRGQLRIDINGKQRHLPRITVPLHYLHLQRGEDEMVVICSLTQDEIFYMRDAHLRRVDQEERTHSADWVMRIGATNQRALDELSILGRLAG